MVKKGLMVLVLAMFVAGGAFAQFGAINLSFGGGALFDVSLNNGSKNSGFKYEFPSGSGNEVELKAQSSGINATSFGLFGFVDATYAVLDVSFAYGIGKMWMVDDGTRETVDENWGFVQLGFSLMGKFPIDLGGFTVFPLLGFNYNAVLSASFDGETIKKDEWPREGDSSALRELSQFGLLIGGGLDFPIDNNLFIRGELLMQLRFANKMMRDGVSSDNKYYKDEYDVNAGYSTTMGWGPRVKVGVGFRL
jgi:hypothetical protein